ncbi:6194_t:CDS:2, partial [Racocetra persica]
IIRLGLLPLSLEDEKNILADNLNNFFGLPRSYDVILERKKLCGLLDAIMILFGLLSCNDFFVKDLSCKFLRFCGQISFSMYLLHPIAMSWVNIYVPSIEFQVAIKEINELDKGNMMLDA